MKITLISQNVQRTNNPAKVDVIRNYFWVLKSGIDFLCLQEHRLRGERLLAFGNLVWLRAKFYAREATLGYGHTMGGVGAGKGGVCMWVAPQIQHMVISSGFSRCGRAQWVRLGGTPRGDLSVLNVYASTICRERMELWAELQGVLDKDCRWLLAGD